MSDFTPGPWFAGWADGITGPNAADMLEWKGKFPICVINQQTKWREPIAAVIDSEQGKADARLIAAAPDLLAALEAIINEYAGISDNWSRAARAAIAKAKGTDNG